MSQKLNKRVLVFETSLSGHRGYYVKVLAKHLAELGFEVGVTVSDGSQNEPEYQQQISDLEGICQFLIVEPCRGKPAQIARQRFQRLVDVVKKFKPQHVYVPYADGLSQVWGAKWFPSKKVAFGDSELFIEGLMMRGTHAYPTNRLSAKLKSLLSFRLTKRARWDCLHHLDPLSYQHFPKTNRHSLLPEATDPLSVTNREEACKILSLPSDKKIIACPGGVNERKGVHLLLKAYQRAALSDTCLVLFGRHSKGIKQLLGSDLYDMIESKRIISVDRFVTNQEFDSLFAVADLIVAPYSNHIGSSSIVIRAARAGKPLVCTNQGWIGWAATRFGLGATCNPHNVNEFAAKLELNGSKDLNHDARGEFVKFHSLENHLAHWTLRIRERAGLSNQQPFPFPLDIFQIDLSEDRGKTCQA